MTFLVEGGGGCCKLTFRITEVGNNTSYKMSVLAYDQVTVCTATKESD